MTNTATNALDNTGTRFLGGLLSTEMIAVFYDMRWMLLVIALCVIADFRYGWGESSSRYERAKRKGDKVLMVQYRWRTSRAIRRTVNKLIDYVVWILVGMAIGMAILEPVGVNHAIGGVCATTIAVVCEAKSFLGHFLYLHGINVCEKSLSGFFKAFVIAFAKKKDESFGDAIEEGFNNSGENGNDNND